MSSTQVRRWTAGRSRAPTEATIRGGCSGAINARPQRWFGTTLVRWHSAALSRLSPCTTSASQFFRRMVSVTAVQP